ncbi:MAG: hypothetical protein Q7S26_00915 [bacterium]|nr:hypothetical protein [bacterium]
MEIDPKEIKARLDIEIGHAAFIADFKGSQDKEWQSQVIRLVAIENPVELFDFQPEEDIEAQNERMMFLGDLCAVLDIPRAWALASYTGQALHDEGDYDSAGDNPLLIESALELAELNSPTPVESISVSEAPSPLVEAVERLGALHESRAGLPWGTTLVE